MFLTVHVFNGHKHLIRIHTHVRNIVAVLIAVLMLVRRGMVARAVAEQQMSVIVAHIVLPAPVPGTRLLAPPMDKRARILQALVPIAVRCHGEQAVR